MNNAVDFEVLSSTAMTLNVEISDGQSSVSSTVTFQIVDVKENITLSVANSALSINEVDIKLNV